MFEEIYRTIESGLVTANRITPDEAPEVFPICDVNNVEYGEEFGDEEIPNAIDIAGE